MAIRLGNNCENCSNLQLGNKCAVHDVIVGNQYTCNSFNMRAGLDNDHDCTSCARFKSESCPHPQKAAEGMLCEAWAPAKVNA